MKKCLPIAFAVLPIAACLSTPTAVSNGDAGAGETGVHFMSDTGIPFGHDSGTSGSSSGTGSGTPGDGGHTTTPDATAPPMDAPPPPPEDAGTRCNATSTSISCSSKTYMEATSDGDRAVTYQVPVGTPPAAGWPVVINFQATDLPPSYAFQASTTDEYAVYGVYYQAELTKNLLDAGFAVLAPAAASFAGDTFWETNISPYATSWSGCADDELMVKMLADIAAGAYGKLDATTLFATGLSSGGYMTSRMALSYPGKFKALAIESGSWATCLSGAGPSGSGTCTVPSPLPAMHPPTLLLHGTLDTTIIPEWTVTAYVTALKAGDVPENEIDDANSGHQWIPEAPAAVLAWFQQYK